MLKYIAKYASKEEKKHESYHGMLTRVSNANGLEALALSAYRRFLAELFFDHYIGALETAICC